MGALVVRASRRAGRLLPWIWVLSACDSSSPERGQGLDASVVVSDAGSSPQSQFDAAGAPVLGDAASDGDGGPTDRDGGSSPRDDAGADGDVSMGGTLPVCESVGPREFEPNPSVGGGGTSYKESAHFRFYDISDDQAKPALDMLEAVYECFVNTLCWRSTGLSINGPDSGPFYKMNFYSKPPGSLGNAAGQQAYDGAAGLAFLNVVEWYLTAPNVTVHEYGHALTYASKTWLYQWSTGAWWETVANFVAETYVTSPLCDKARKAFGQSEGGTMIDLGKVVGDSHLVIVDGSGGGNYYQAWPFLTYLTNNPDGYTGLGPTTVGTMLVSHKGNNETPLHVLERVASPTTVQQIVGRYWARMAYVDIGHAKAQERFVKDRANLKYDNLEALGNGAYRVKAGRRPRYMGANIIPLKGSGNIAAQVTSDAAFTATLAVRESQGTVRYIELVAGAGEATLASGEEASLVVANTPNNLLQYDPFKLDGDPANNGLDYTVQLTNAAP